MKLGFFNMKIAKIRRVVQKVACICNNFVIEFYLNRVKKQII
jgi:hypothetical protein